MKRSDLKELYSCCELCPRRCGADRHERTGFCRSRVQVMAAKAMLHPWEEPAVTEDGRPSGAVFFSGCTLGCVFCQNYAISQEGVGKELSPEQLAAVFLNLQKQGACNIDLVTPTHFLPGILEALDLCRPELELPVVYNCGGYERKEIIELLEDDVDYWLPDLKYYDSGLSARYSKAPDYFPVAVKAVEEMLRQVKKAVKAARTEEARTRAAGPGDPACFSNGSRRPRKLMVVRHMVLPGQREDSVRVLRELADRIGTEGYYLSLLSQYTPFYKAEEHPEINRRVTTYEYEKVLDEALRLGFEGFMQERTSAKEEYTPEFDFQGI